MWVVYALVQSLSASFHAIYSKRLVHRYHYAYVAAATFVFAVPYLTLAVLIQPPRELDSIFWICLMGTSVLNVFANFLLFKATELDDVSFLAPVAAFNPLMTTIVTMFTLGEIPKARGLFGVVLIVIGSYVLSKSVARTANVSFVRFFTRKSILLILGTYLIWSFTPTLEKTAMLHASPQNPAYLSLGMSIVIALGLFLIARAQGINALSQFRKNWKEFIPIGFFLAAAMLSSFAAFTQVFVGYAVAVMRTNIFFSIIFARIFLGERGIRTKLWASVFMFFGILLLVF